LSDVVLFTGARSVATCATPRADSILGDVAIAVRDGRILTTGPERALGEQHPDASIVDCTDRVITPGFVDSHTHAVFGSYRAQEYALRSRGVSYMEIARKGGGINSSVKDVRAKSQVELESLTRERLRTMLALGTTTAEVKSGYGLETEAELKMLRVVRTLAAEGPIDLVPTFLGAHEFPPEYRERRDDYVDLIIDEMIPAVAAEKLAIFCDVFMEPGVYTPEQTRRVLEAGIEHGLRPKLHADELDWSGGAELAAVLGAASADHLGVISDAGIRALARSGTVATLLPGTLFFLGKATRAPARRLIDAGATVALASDYNPGSSPSPSMPLVMTMACSSMGMDPIEALYAATAGGAAALELDDGTGTIAAGSPADLIVWDVRDCEEIPYHFGRPPIESVWKSGTRVA
jgi:imidazolonepropionase